MDNEETKILLPQQGTGSAVEQMSIRNAEQTRNAGKADTKKSAGKQFGARVAATAAGAALGTGVAMAADHAAHATDEQRQAPDVDTNDHAAVADDGKDTVETATHPEAEPHAAVAAASNVSAPTEQEAVLVTDESPVEHQTVMTDEGVRVAQVDDSASFSEAFDDARAQVGAGGVFEWHGKVYNTFTKDEWSEMSASERAEWHSHVDYDDVAGTAQVSAHASVSQHAYAAPVEAVPEDASYVDNDVPQAEVETADVQDSEVHVIGMAVQDNGQGGLATIAGLQAGDDMAMVVDVDSDGTVDYVVHDDNANGQYEADEWHDVSADGMPTAQVVSAYVDEAQENGSDAMVTNMDTGEQYHITESEDGYGLVSSADCTSDANAQMACDDDMPDYMNDADAGIMEA